MSPSSAESKPSSANCRARLERAAAPLAHRFAEAPAVRALQESLPVAFAVALAALLARLAAALLGRPFPGWAAFRALIPFLPSAFALASAVMIVVLSLRLARRLGFSPAAMAVVAVAAFGLALPRDADAALAAFARTRAPADLAPVARTLGVSGIFTAIVIALAVAGAFALGRARFGAARGAVAGALAVLAAFALLFAARLSPAGALATALAPLAALGDSFAALLIITTVESVLWLVGIHGPALLAALVFPVYLQLQVENTAAFAHHEPVPHLVVVSTFLFVFPGGAGATLPLVALLMRSRVPRLRAFGFATIVPALVNVNDPVIFGLPVAYNPVLAVPFVVAPVVLSCTTYAALALGWVARPLFYTPSSVPAFVNVFLATLDWRACVLVALNLALAGAIWLPFVRVYERTEAARAARAQTAPA
ncbi:MAG TPA: PTS transporter subunit EIIC [Dongiaceae bacterium]|nr:PTS transporter subunit EIIC [Dongiaceae bacterium]